MNSIFKYLSNHQFKKKKNLLTDLLFWRLLEDKCSKCKYFCLIIQETLVHIVCLYIFLLLLIVKNNYYVYLAYSFRCCGTQTHKDGFSACTASRTDSVMAITAWAPENHWVWVYEMVSQILQGGQVQNLMFGDNIMICCLSDSRWKGRWRCGAMYCREEEWESVDEDRR